jgi:mannan endo-1,4-beta-mannosidase
MNRAALAARLFLGAVLMPIVGAAGWAAYEYRVQPPAPVAGSQRMFATTQLLSSQQVPPGFLLGTFAGVDPATLAAFNKHVGAKVSLTIKYMHWGTVLPATYMNSAARWNIKTIIELQPRGKHVLTMAQIAAGRGDAWIEKLAANIVSLRQPFILSFAPEMNGNWYIYGHRYVSGPVSNSAFRHVHDVLVADIDKRLKKLQLPGTAGSLVSFMWQPSAIHKNTYSPRTYWPGSRYVNIVGLDGYYYYAHDTFATVFGRTLRIIRSLTKTPVMIGETAAGPVFNRQAWEVNDLFAGIRRNNLLGMIWFDENQDLKSYPVSLRPFHQDWRLEDHPAALSAFIKALTAQKPFASFAQRPANG